VGEDKLKKRKGKEKGPTYPNCICISDARHTIIYLHSFVTNFTTMRIQAEKSGLSYLKQSLAVVCTKLMAPGFSRPPAPYASQLLKGYKRREKAIKFEWRNIHPVSETYCMHPIRKQGHPLRLFGRHITVKYTTYEDRQNGRESYYGFYYFPVLLLVCARNCKIPLSIPVTGQQHCNMEPCVTRKRQSLMFKFCSPSQCTCLC